MGPASIFFCITFTVLDPNFGFALLILEQSDFLGARSFNGNPPLLESLNGPLIIIALFFSGIAWMLLFAGIEMKLGDALLGWRRKKDPGALAAAKTPETAKQPRSELEEVTEDEERRPSETFAFSRISASRASSAAASAAAAAAFHANFDPTRQLDRDVAAENDRVAAVRTAWGLDTTEHALFVTKVSKAYPRVGNTPAKLAVHNFNVSVPKGQIFGLLGANGAGPSSIYCFAEL